MDQMKRTNFAVHHVYVTNRVHSMTTLVFISLQYAFLSQAEGFKREIYLICDWFTLTRFAQHTFRNTILKTCQYTIPYFWTLPVKMHANNIFNTILSLKKTLYTLLLTRQLRIAGNSRMEQIHAGSQWSFLHPITKVTLAQQQRPGGETNIEQD